MDKELKSKWVEALRSGKYRQGEKSLHDPESNTFCCLGVLCDVANFRSRSLFYICGPIQRELVEDDMQGRLANMNDEGKSFAEIADYIEAHL